MNKHVYEPSPSGLVNRTNAIPAGPGLNASRMRHKASSFSTQLRLLCRLFPFCCLAASLLSWGPHARAQEEGETVELEELVVEGIRKMFEDGTEEKLKAVNFKDVLATDAIGNLPDKNIGDALNRLPGVTLELDKGEGRYVSIRGVETTLNNIVFDGENVGASDVRARGGRKAPLELLSAASVGGLEISKTVTPDMDGNSIGGTVNVLSRSAFDQENKSFVSLSAEAGVNDRLLGSDAIYGASVAWGYRFGAREQWGLFLGADYSSRDYNVHFFDTGSWEEIEPGAFMPGTIDRTAELGNRERWGTSLNLEYRPSEGSEFYVRGLFTRLDDISISYQMNSTIEEDQTALTPTSGTGSGKFELEGRQRYERRETWRLVFGGKHRLGELWTLEGSINTSEGREVRDENVYEFKDPIFSDLGDDEFQPIEWDVSIPYRPVHFFPSGVDGNQDLIEDASLFGLSRFRVEPATIPDRIWTARLDLTRELDLYGHGGFLKFGFKYSDREKIVNNNSIRWRPRFRRGDPGTVRLTDGFARDFSELFGAYFDGGYRNSGVGPAVDAVAAEGLIFPGLPQINGQLFEFGSDGLPMAGENDFWRFDDEGSAGNSVEDDYVTNEEIWAGYFMIDLRPSDRLIVTAGVRGEDTSENLRSNSVVENGGFQILPIESSNAFTHWMPNAQFRYELSDSLLLRGAFTYTIGRPDYIDMSPLSEFEVEDELGPNEYRIGSLEIGNPDLDPFESRNWDVSLSHSHRGGFIEAGYFYKSIDNPIYAFETTEFDVQFQGFQVSTLDIESVRNADEGTIEGVEFIFQQHLFFLPEPLDGFGINVNYTLMSSDVTVPERPGESFRFFNQPGEVGNLQVYYQRGGFEARAAYRWQDEQLLIVGNGIADDTFEDESSFLDLRVSQRLGRHWSVYFEASNLTDEVVNRYVVRPGLPGDSPGEEQWGRTYRLGFSWSR